jgi:DNA-3-methyladenine glycosylase
MFGPPGRAYVYRIHRATCFNVVTGPEDLGEAVLIRAVEPLEGLALMELARRCGTVGRTIPVGFALTNGPGKLCQALDITLADYGSDLLEGPVCAAGDGRASWLALEPRPSRRRVSVECSTRIGISKAQDAPLRFFVAGNPWVSVRRRPVQWAGSRRATSRASVSLPQTAESE